MVRFLSREFRNIWNEDRGLTIIFILLCISNFLVIPFFGHQGTLIHLLTRIIWFLLLIAGITTLAENKTQMRNFSIIPVLLVITTILESIIDYKILYYFGFAIDLAVFVLLIVMVLIKVFEPGSITVHRIIGSIVVYMLIGDVWAQLYHFIYINIPGSIQFPAVDVEGGVTTSAFLYFSFTTLTTTGFGDILPLNPIARTLLMIEQMIGVLLPVVLIGRLVSLIAGDSARKPDDDKE
jgi:hypothetical protein